MRAAEWSESGRGLNLVIGRNFCETPRYTAVTSVVLNTLHQSHSYWQFIVADSDSPVPLISETTSLLLERDTMRLVRRHFVSSVSSRNVRTLRHPGNDINHNSSTPAAWFASGTAYHRRRYLNLGSWTSWRSYTIVDPKTVHNEMLICTEAVCDDALWHFEYLCVDFNNGSITT